MQDRNPQYPIQNSIQNLSTLISKKIGNYLLDAGLLTADQINVALNDQQATGMRFGEVIVARGWLKEQTIEWIMLKVIEPERQALQRQKLKHQEVNRRPIEPILQPANGSASHRVLQTAPRPAAASETPAKANSKFTRREAPISKPLPPVNSVDNDVNWVG